MEFKDFFKEKIGINDETLLEELCAESRLYQLKKDEHIVRQGEIQQNAYFLLDGIMRGYTLTAKGVDITESFAFHYGEPIVPYCGFTEPSEISISAVTDALCIAISVSSVFRLSHEYPEILELHNRMLAENYKQHLESKNNIYTMNVQERYHWFLSKYPGLIERVKHRDIASFIGVTPVSLSRIRGREHHQSL